jgi:hypothetical protein
MYPRRLFSKALSETRKFWTIHRNWTVASGPLAATAIRAYSVGWKTVKTDLSGTLVMAVAGYAASWLGTFLINLVRGIALLDKEHTAEATALGDRIAELTSELERERETLTGCPQLIIGFNEEFFIRNIGGEIHGRDARIHSMQIGRLILYSDEIAYAGPGDTVFALRCRATDDVGDGSPVLRLFQTSAQAFQMFIDEVIKTQPIPDTITSDENPARRATRKHQFLMMNNHMLVLNLLYSDFSGHRYLSPALIVWTLRDGGRIVEIRPQPIKKLLAAEAAEWDRGEYIKEVAGLTKETRKRGAELLDR